MNHRFLIVSDLDGTLLSSEKKILPKTKKLLLELQKEGHIIALASGRPPRAVLPYYEELGLDGPIITYNGACVYDPKDKSFPPYHFYFKKEDVIDYINKFEEGDIVEMFAETDDTIYFMNEENKFSKMFHLEGMKIVTGDFRKTLHEDVYAFVFKFKDQKTMDRGLKEELHDDNLFFRSWYDCRYIAELGTYTTSKATGIEKIRLVHNIDKAHTIAFGDAENDVEMLTSVGIPFAMKNASEKLKSLVPNITEYDNDHEGIYYALKKLFER